MSIRIVSLLSALIILVTTACDGSGTSSGPGQPADPGTTTRRIGNIPDGAMRLDECPLAMTEVGEAYLKAHASGVAGSTFVRIVLEGRGTPEEGWTINLVYNAEEGDAIWHGPDYRMIVPEQDLEAMAEIKLHYGGMRVNRGYMILGIDEEPPPDRP